MRKLFEKGNLYPIHFTIFEDELLRAGIHKELQRDNE
jgi:hypothetical protein